MPRFSLKNIDLIIPVNIFLGFLYFRFLIWVSKSRKQSSDV